jgi:hypothetical protein
MKNQMSERLIAWYNGDLEDSELTSKEIQKLEERVFNAVVAKILERPNVYTFAEHRPLQ